MADQKVSVRIGAKDEASRTVEKVESRFKRFGSFLASKFVITLGDVTRLMRGVAGVFTSTVEAAKKQEDAVKALDAALDGLGGTATESSKGLQDQAAALQKVTKYGDEAVIKSQAFLATLGVQADKLPIATQATVDLAAALGISLEAAARNVGKTVGGFAGELGEVIPELKDLSVEALRSGAGIELLAEKFSGRAAADAKTFGGIMAQLGNAFGDLKEKVGEAITQNEGLRQTLSSLVKTLSSDETVAVVTKLAAGIGAIANATVGAVTAIPNFIAGLQGLGSVVRPLGVAIDALVVSFRALYWLWDQTVGNVGRVVKGVADLGAALNAEAKAVREAELAQKALNARIEGGQAAFAAVLDPAKATTTAYTEAADAAAKLTGASTDAASATEELGNALGVVTSLELAAEIGKITASLEKSREELGANSDEYVRLEQLAGEKIEKLRERIQSLKDGMGDLKEKTSESAGAFDEYGAAIEAATGKVDALTNSVQGSVSALTSQTTAASGGGLFEGLSGKSYTHQTFTPATLADLTYSGGGTFYRGREVRVLPDGRIEWA